MSQFKETIVHKGPPVAAAFGSAALGAPWFIGLAILFGAPYWYGPMLIYSRQRLPTRTPLRLLPDDATLPEAHQQAADTAVVPLVAEGFAVLGRLVGETLGKIVNGSVTVLQNPQTSDIAQVLVVNAKDQPPAVTFSFSRRRTDGSRLWTTRNAITSPFPPNPLDSVFRIADSALGVLDLWRIHKARIASDKTVGQNPPITDVLLFQQNLEEEAARRNVESGLWQPAENPQYLRPTAHGALLMTLRMLSPWKDWSRRQAQQYARSILAE